MIKKSIEKNSTLFEDGNETFKNDSEEIDNPKQNSNNNFGENSNEQLPVEEYDDNFLANAPVDDSQYKNSNVDLEAIETLLFPHSEIREAQDNLIKNISETIKLKQNLLVHAPTGLGKTAASLSAALTHITKQDNKNLTIYFLTSRHTQHRIVIETMRKINEKFNLNIVCSSIIGKKNLCLQPNVEGLSGKDFADFCKLLVEGGKCEYYSNFKSGQKIMPAAEYSVSELKKISRGVITTENIIECSSEKKLCPYEISLLTAKQARVIITDYSYIFNPSIRDNFFRKINKELKDAIIIIDEAHNLPSRVKDQMSEYMSTIMIKRAISEAKKFGHLQIIASLEEINNILESYAKPLAREQMSKYARNSPEVPKSTPKITLDSFSSGLNVATQEKEKSSSERFSDAQSEIYINKKEFIERIEQMKDYDELASELIFLGDSVREDQHQSYIGSIGAFLQTWLNDDIGFTRILSTTKLKDSTEMITLSYRCLDPSIVVAPVVENAYSTIMMSGTFTPTSMYRELFGIEANELTLKSPFPTENRLNLIIPKTSTKYESRSQTQYQEIAKTLIDISESVDGCIAIYYPSYYLMGEITKHLDTKISKPVFTENPGMNKSEKQDFMNNFSAYKTRGALLNAVITGSFAEGIDMPGVLKAVVVVGLPLQKPDLETKALIDYYDVKFKKGWDYGYLYPAFTKTIQAAGRCIRTETDKGVIIFLDERYSWNNYYRCFPVTWNMKVSLLYKDLIKDFFKN